MALYDIDKSNDDRGKPSLNVNDTVQNRMAHNTMGNSYRTAGLGVTPRMRFMNSLIVTYDDEDRVSSVYGYIPEVAPYPVLITALEGYDVFADLLEIDPPTV